MSKTASLSIVPKSPRYSGKVCGWDESHPLSKYMNQLWKEMVPAQGEAETENGELIRAAGRLVYEYCNNGNLNAGEQQSSEEVGHCMLCGGQGTYDDDECEVCMGGGTVVEKVEGDIEIVDYYEDFLQKIQAKLPDLEPNIDALRDLITNPSLHYNYNYNKEEAAVYNDVVCKVVAYVWKEEKGEDI